MILFGIGNPVKYKGTRHNVGKYIIEQLRRELCPNIEYKKGKRYEYVECDGGDTRSERLVLCRSVDTFMNHSGLSIKEYLRGRHGGAGSLQRMVVVHDELELSIGKIKMRDGGSSNRGHNGLKSVYGEVGPVTKLGIGIGRPSRSVSAGKGGGDDDVVEYVLSEMSETERRIIREETVPRVLMLLNDQLAARK
ncbi:hypothetical protein Kpol_237p5 [Vanderwaltozyma polyspora DSM 70294]|uniref:Peptidyl-tRNA hydrolase n=1 Tax=Vanderwaltozyma polyspora (strain ATCC 22028 / DSM 70294 / BCRC 21397 / CBS 2163 / NBRC 10782 / NRRL Y-8283 / UCD 57-17) TaxID=436907 RepID=A7TTK2_VANPO|nr:uncharacterized protein Kpol_237p5 [Vanderwaltozyma polyspora DSM 70294]EDO14409.1 hypothetical protein Kpol_237p5 [Vanderwaltozyma polyspora DSM 70294]